MPYDHIRVRLRQGLLAEIGNYTAASKLALSLPVLLGIIKQKPAFVHINHMTQDKARELLKRSLKTILLFTEEYPEYRAFLPWVDIKPVGKVAPATEKIPSLDNGQLTWTLAAIVSSFENSTNPKDKELAELAQKILNLQNYGFFYDSKKGLMHGTIQKNPYTDEWSGDSTYYLNDMFEGILAILWGVLHGQVPEEAWNNVEIPTVDYTTLQGEKVTTFLGFRASFHEHWALIYLPLMETPLKELYKNYLHVQTDHANKRNLPGFISTAYDSRGNYRQMGVPKIAKHNVDRDDVAVVFATALSMMINPSVGANWLEKLYQFKGLLTSYGAVESVAPDGFADIFTADAKGVTIMGASGGVVEEVKAYLSSRKVPGTDKLMITKFQELIASKYRQMEKERKEKPVYIAKEPFMAPPSKFIQVKEKTPADLGDAFSITDNFQNGHLHGKNVRSVGQRTLENDAFPGRPFTFDFEISPNQPFYDQWAYRGTYIDEAVRIADMQFLHVEIPVDFTPRFFEIELKSDDINLVVAQIDTTMPGMLSEDGKWKTIVKSIRPIPESDYKLFNYFSVVNPDPRYLPEQFRSQGQKGTVYINNVWLSKKPTTATSESVKRKKMIDDRLSGKADIYDVLPYWRVSHGDLTYQHDDINGNCMVRAGQGWRGGYFPYVDLEKFPYLQIEFKNHGKWSNHFWIELKHEETHLIGEKGIRLDVKSNSKSHIFEFELKDPIEQTANYFAVSSVFMDLEVIAITFSAHPDPRQETKRINFLRDKK